MGKNDEYKQLEKTKNAYLTTGQLAKAVTKISGLRCTTSMIYNFEKHDLISPDERTEGGYRLFNIDTLARVIKIKKMQERGISLDDIEGEISEEPDIVLDETLVELPTDKKNLILEAALKIFPQKGYENTKMDDIAEEAGIYTPVIYQYFESKEELFLELIDVISFRNVMESMAEALYEDSAVDTVEEVSKKLERVGEAFLNTHYQNKEIVRLFINEARQYPRVGQQYCNRLIEPVEELIKDYLKHHIEEGLFREIDVEPAVHAFYGMFLNYVITQKLLCGEGVLNVGGEDQVSKLVDIFLYGIVNQAPQ